MSKISILEGRPELAGAVDRAAEVAGYLWTAGWAERNGGNLTVNVTEYADDEMRALPALGDPLPIGKTLPSLKGCWFYAKGTGRRMRDLARRPMENGCIIRICDDCAHYEMVADEPVVPTSELPSHLALQDYLIASGSSYKATLHTHPIELVAMSHLRRFCDSEALTRTLWSMIPETLAFAPLGLGFVPFRNPGTVAVGTDIMDALDQTDVLNKAAKIYLAARQMGQEPEGMSDAAMEEIQQLFNLPRSRVK